MVRPVDGRVVVVAVVVLAAGAGAVVLLDDGDDIAPVDAVPAADAVVVVDGAFVTDPTTGRIANATLDRAGVRYRYEGLLDAAERRVGLRPDRVRWVTAFARYPDRGRLDPSVTDGYAGVVLEADWQEGTIADSARGEEVDLEERSYAGRSVYRLNQPAAPDVYLAVLAPNTYALSTTERVADIELPLYTADAQRTGGDVRSLTVRSAVEAGAVEPWVAYYLGRSLGWYDEIGVDMDRFRYRQHHSEELSHYAADCWDAEAEVEDDWIELTGFAYRGSYDLEKHAAGTGEEYSVFRQYDEPVTVERPTVDPDMSELGPAFGSDAAAIATALEELVERDPDAFEGERVVVEAAGDRHEVPVEHTGFAVEEVTESGEHITPHVVEPSFGIDRLVYTVLAHGYNEDTVDGEKRAYLAVPPAVAPTTVGVLPLMDRDGLAERARTVAERLRAAGIAVAYDDSGSIGRRYRRQDEIGTPFCVTVDYESLEEETVTVRDRDTTAQRRIQTDGLTETLRSIRDGDRSFEEL